jgi:hypothetical protein
MKTQNDFNGDMQENHILRQKNNDLHVRCFDLAASNCRLIEACEQAFLMLANVEALKRIDDGTDAGKNVDSKRMEVMERISQAINSK